MGRGCGKTLQAEESVQEKGQKLWKRISTREVRQGEVASGRRGAAGELGLDSDGARQLCIDDVTL